MNHAIEYADHFEAKFRSAAAAKIGGDVAEMRATGRTEHEIAAYEFECAEYVENKARELRGEAATAMRTLIEKVSQ